MSEYSALPNYAQPDERQHVPNVTTGTRIATAEEQKPLVRMLNKMLTPKLSRMMKGKISPQSVKVGHKKKQNQVIYY